MVFDIVLDLVFSMGLTFGVGASTFTLMYYISSLQDGVVDDAEKRFLHIMYTVLRFGSGLLLVAIIAKIASSVLPLPHVLLMQATLLCIIATNAILMSYKLMPMQYGPTLAGGSWYYLMLVTQLQSLTLSLYALFVYYLLFICFFHVLYSQILKRVRTKAGQSGTTHVCIEKVTDASTLEAYAHDASVFSVTPKAVYYPKNVHEIIQLVAECREEKKTNKNASLTVRAGGTCMSGGPLNDGWIVDMTRHMKSIVIDRKKGIAVVEMGARFKDVEAEAEKYGLMFPAYPSSRLLCGIGGMIGNNASGEKSIRYGATSDNVISLDVVLADGSVITVEKKDISALTEVHEKQLLELARQYGDSLRVAVGTVKKSSSGYNLHKVIDDTSFNAIPVFVGAQGTLGIVTRATLKLVPKPKYLELLIISASDLTDVSPILETIFRHNPEGIETFDIHTYIKAQEHLTVSAGKVRKYIDPKAHLFILAQFSEATDTLTEAQAEKCFAELVASGYFVKHIDTQDDTDAAWDVRRNSYTLMRDHNEEGFKAVPCIEDVIVPLPAMGEFIKALIAILKKRKIKYGFHGHIGDGSLRIIPVFDFRAPMVADTIIDLMKDVFKLVKKHDGNTSADHSDGIIRSPFLRTFYGKELYGAFEKIKSLYDSEGIMNPHKKVGSTIQYLKKHMK